MNKDWNRITDARKASFMKARPQRNMSWEKGDISVGIIMPSRPRRESEIRDLEQAKRINFSKRVQEMTSADDNLRTDELGGVGVDNEERKVKMNLSRFEGCLLGGAVGELARIGWNYEASLSKHLDSCPMRRSVIGFSFSAMRAGSMSIGTTKLELRSFWEEHPCRR